MCTAVNAQVSSTIQLKNGNTLTVEQNDLGMTTELRDARGVATKFQYDQKGRVLEEHSAERGLLQYTYDEAGNIVLQVNEGGLVFKREYDDKNRLTKHIMKQHGVDRKVNRRFYDNCENGEGKLCKAISDGHVTKYAYTLDGRVAKISTKYSEETNFETTRFTYDEKGQTEKVFYPTGLMVRYHYNDTGAVNKVTGRYNTGENSETFVIAKNIKFDPNSEKLTRLTFGNGLKTKLSYDSSNRLENTKTLQNDIVIDSSTYSRNSSGHVTEVSKLNTEDTLQYAYDESARLVKEQQGVDLSAQSLIEYSYDAVGNRLTRNDGQKTTSYTYASNANRLDQINRKTLSYDVMGNLISDRNGKRSFTYDVTNRMTEFHKNDELRASYEYNVFGQRIRKTLHRSLLGGSENHKTLNFAYTHDGWLLSEQGRNTNKQRTFARDYVWLYDRPIAQIERKIRADGTTLRTQVSYIHTDHLKTPRWATDENTNVVWRWKSDAFGKGKANRDVDGDGEKTAIHLRFPGQYFDRESGLYYNHHRDYDPDLGRYIQSDPIGLEGGINRYAYVEGNPVNFIDPTGLYACTNNGDDGLSVYTGEEIVSNAGEGIACSDGSGSGGSGSSLGAGIFGSGNGPSFQVASSGPGFSAAGANLSYVISLVLQELQSSLETFCEISKGAAKSMSDPLIPNPVDAIDHAMNNVNSGLRTNFPWVSIQTGASAFYYGGGGFNYGIYSHPNGQYGVFLTPAVGVGAGAEVHLTMAVHRNRPAGISGSFQGTGALLRGRLNSTLLDGIDNAFLGSFEAGISGGASLSATLNYTFAHSCGNYNE